MIDFIDVHDLPEEHAKIIQHIAERMRSNLLKIKDKTQNTEETIKLNILTPYPSDVIERFSRGDIYDDEYFTRRISGH